MENGLNNIDIKKIKEEINRSNYWEHFKKAKDIALYLPTEHPQRQLIQIEMNSILEQLTQTAPATVTGEK